MQAEEHSGSKRIAGSGGPRNRGLRHMDDLAARVDCIDDPTAMAPEGKWMTTHSRVPASTSWRAAVPAAERSMIPSLMMGMPVVRSASNSFKNAIVTEPQRGQNNLSEPITFHADHVHAGLKPGGLRPLEHGCRHGSTSGSA